MQRVAPPLLVADLALFLALAGVRNCWMERVRGAAVEEVVGTGRIVGQTEWWTCPR